MFVRKLIGYFPSLLLKTRLEIHVYKRYQSVPSLATASFALKMNLEKNIAYLRYREEENRFETTFILDTDNVTFKKSICIVRPVDETIETYLSKIDHKVMQILEKKMVKKLKKKGKDEPVELPEVKSKFLQNNELVKDIKCETLFQGPPAENYKLRILDVEYNVTINSPWVESIKLPTEVYVGFTFFPIKFDAHSTDKELSEFVWFKSSDSTKKLSWNECGRGYCYTPKAEDAGHLLLLQCTPKNKYSTGPVCEIMSRPVLSFDHTCPFERRHTYSKEKAAPDEIRVVSYNILADIYAETKEAINNLFSYCKQEYLAITYRRPLIIKELQGYNADLICLQEVDSSLYYKCLKEIFSIYGFSSEMYEKGAAREGTAIFYDNQKFKMIKSLHHVLSEDLENNESLRDLYDKLKENEQLMFRCKRLGTTLQILALQSLIKPNEIILVGNTHLYFHPDADHIRLLQGVMCMKLLQIHLEEIKNENPDKNVNIIFCGDFNSVPECGIYQLVTKGFVDSSHPDWNSNAEEAIKDLNYSHPLKIDSACGTPKYTNYTHLFKDCLDYIYYQTDRLEVKQVVPFPTEEELNENEAIPSAVFPSDHVALVADLKWKV